jgi:putative metal-binding protein
MAIERRMGWGGAAVLVCMPLLTGCGNDEPEVQTASLAVGCVPRVCYYDGDGDGYGILPAIEACGAVGCGAKMAESAGDCDDHDPALHPRQEEKSANGVDDNCNGQADEATYDGPPYWRVGNLLTDEPVRPPLRLNNAPEIAQARQSGTLYGRVYYRELAEASAPYQVTGLQPAEVYDAGVGGVFARFAVDDLAPLTAYEMRIDLYRLQVTPSIPPSVSFVRIAPHGGCQGNSNSTPACSNSGVKYLITESAAAFGSLNDARATLVKQALDEKGFYDLGWAIRDGNDSQFYAASAKYILSDLDPSSHYDEATIRSWFLGYPDALSEGAGYDLAALRPGDWLSVGEGPSQAGRTRMFLARDALAGTYWFVEGDGRRETPWGPVLHSVRVASAKSCDAACANPADGSCDPGCTPARWVGKLKAAMLD